MEAHPDLVGICAELLLDPARAELVQQSVNWTYRFPLDGLVLRVGRDSPRVDHLVRVARELERLDAPTVRLAPGFPQPARRAGWAATVWLLLPSPPAERYPASDLVVPLRTLHACRLGPDLPRWNLPGSVRQTIEDCATDMISFTAWSSRHLDRTGPELLDALRRRSDDLAGALAAPRWALPMATVHGDAHTGNLLRSGEGGPVLCDLDSVSWGPAEVDLVPAAHGVTRFGRDPGDYRRLTEGYGFDVRDSPAWPALRRLRDLQLAAYLLPTLPGPPVAAEVAHRLRTVLSDDAEATWHRYPHMS